MNYDKILVNIFFGDHGIINSYYRKFYNNPIKYRTKYINIKNYLYNRYDDSKSLKETLYRMKYNIDIRPTCKICGAELELSINNKKNKVFPIYCSVSCEMKDPEVMKKHNDACLKKYGSVNNIDKRKITCLNKYGVDEAAKVKEIYKKSEETKFLKYNDKHYNNQNKHRETMINKYGVKSSFQLPHVREHCTSEETKQKIIESKRKNHSFNTSKPEVESFNLLKEKYPDVIRQYKDERYPFLCDFYIPSLDLYIECNYHWTHGGHPFNSENKYDQIQLNEWINNNTKYYNNAIGTWVIRDVNKRNTAKENKLNYIEFWNIDELKNWLK